MKSIVLIWLLLCWGLFSFSQPWDNVIEYIDTTQTINLIGESWNNTLIRNCKIHDTNQVSSGIYLKDVSNVRIENCEIYNIGGHGGIQFSNTGNGTEKVEIEGNKIYNCQKNGIAAPQRSQAKIPLTQLELKIIGNMIYNTGMSSSRGSYHAIYCQASDFLIEKNRIFGERDGNGISVRSSGIISKNIVSGWSKSNKPAIRYFSDHMKGTTDSLIIENNIAWNDSTDAHVIELHRFAPLYQNNREDTHVVKNFNIRFNTSITFKDDKNAVYIHDDYGNDGYKTVVDGNIVINIFNKNNTMAFPSSTNTSGNYIGTSFDNFVNPHPPYNFRITKLHQAVNYSTGKTKNYPLEDIDGEKRTPNVLDAGADQITISFDLK
jgi:hypothetical protein